MRGSGAIESENGRNRTIQKQQSGVELHHSGRIITLPVEGDYHMLLAARIIAGIVGLLHIWIFLMESVLWMRPAIFGRFGVKGKDQAEILRNVFFNQGFYNLFLAAGCIYGAVFFQMHPTYAPAIMMFACASVMGAGIVLLASAGSRMARAAIIQGLPPAVTLGLIAATML